jgi:ATP-dependent Lhr-like helicase
MKHSHPENRHKFKLAIQWFKNKGWKPFKYQKDTWSAFLSGKSGLLNAPTGSGKTYALWIPAVIEVLDSTKTNKKAQGLRIIWITPLRALAKDIQLALQLFVDDIGLDWVVDIRTGDTSPAQRAKQLRSAPTCLITTPESLHILFSQKQSAKFFDSVNCIMVDEWHELLTQLENFALKLRPSKKNVKF